MRRRPVLQKLGGGWQLLIEIAADLDHALTLDDARWACTCAPVDLFAVDPAFLSAVDTDRDGRIRTDELRAAIAWTLHRLKDRDGLERRSDALHLPAVDDSHEDGRRLRQSAQQVLENLGLTETVTLTLAQVRDRRAILASGAANGDGVIPPASVQDPVLAHFLGDIVKTLGGAADAGGQAGVDAAKLETFVKLAQGRLAWLAEGRLPEGQSSTPVLPLGTKTAEAWDAVAPLADKFDQYFALCAAVQVDKSVAEAMTHVHPVRAPESASAQELTDALRALPLAEPDPDEVLTLDENVNPAHREALGRFCDLVLPHFVKNEADRLPRHVWEAIRKAFAPYVAWRDREIGKELAAVPERTLREYADSPLAEKVRDLIRTDAAVADEIARVTDVEKLILCQRWLIPFCRDFISFPDLYHPERRSLIEQGTLIMDGRRFTLSVRVRDRRNHVSISGRSSLCLLYCEVSRRRADGTEEKFEIATAVTAGTMRNLFPGKKGIFVDREGHPFEARVVEVLENPVSLWEAVKQPFVRLGQFVGKQAERFTSSRYGDIEKRIDTAVTQADQSVQEQMSQPAKPSPKATRTGALRDVLVGGGVALAALGGTLGYLSETVSRIGWTGIGKAVLGIAALIALPALIVAYLKLRRRDLSMLLEASGMAMNTDMLLRPHAGGLFTRVPAFPEESERRRFDLVSTYTAGLPERSRKRALLLLAVLLGLAIGGTIGWWRLRQREHVPSTAPASTAPADQPAAPTPAAAAPAPTSPDAPPAATPEPAGPPAPAGPLGPPPPQ